MQINSNDPGIPTVNAKKPDVKNPENNKQAPSDTTKVEGFVQDKNVVSENIKNGSAQLDLKIFPDENNIEIEKAPDCPFPLPVPGGMPCKPPGFPSVPTKPPSSSPTPEPEKPKPPVQGPPKPYPPGQDHPIP